MLAKRVKGNQIKIQYAQNRLGEIESYTLLDLTEEELRKLLKASKNNYHDVEKQMWIISTLNDQPVVDAWLEIAHNHQLKSKSFNGDVNKKYTAPYKAKAYLFRDQDRHIIKFHLVKPEDGDKKCSINVLAIEQHVVDIYLKQVRQSESYKELGKCFIVAEYDERLYHLWANYMNKQYFENIRK